MTKSFKKPRKHQLRQLAKQVISFMLIASLLFGLIPEGVYASNNVKSVTNEKTFKSKECNITYVEDSTWGNYVNATIRIENQGSQDIEDWKISFDYDGTIDNIWNADILSCENGHYIIGAKSYNQKIAKGQTISFGMIAYGKNQKPTMPSKITLGEEEKEEEQPTEIEDSSLPKQYQALSYAALSGGNKNFSLATNETYIGGNVHSNGGFTYQGTKLTIEGILETVSNIEIRTSSGTDCEKVEKKQENTASLSIPDLSKGIKEKLKEEGKVYQASKDFGQDTIVIDHSMWVNGNLNFNGTSFLGEGIVAAKDSIQYNVNSLKTGADARIFLMSQEGNITLNGSDITMNAVLYAPNGCVTVNANQFHLNGRIIAKEIRIHGTNIRIMSGKSDLSMIEFLWKPDLSIETSGFHKVNRKVVLELQGAENTDLTEEMVQWEITSAQEKKDTYSVDTTASNGLHQELLFHEAGTYEVTATVTNKGEKQQVKAQLNIEPDLAPVANFEIKETSVVRDEQKNATISMIDLSASPDGDEIKQRIWTIYYDENNNGKFEQEEATIVSDKNEKNFTYTTKKVGRYQVALEVVEEIKDTIPSLLKDTDYLRDNTLEKESGNTFFVDNKAPTSNLSIEKKRSADLVFTVGDVNKEGLAKYNEKAKEIKEALEKQGVDVRVETVSSSTLTAKDTFAWKEYGHTNYDDNNEGNHIRYEENNIRMVGYESRPVKDFLYVADNDPGQKIFTFDLQRDQTDWHSMEGGGFLFNTTIDEEKNTIRGFCILVTYEGLKLVQIDCNNLSGFRDGYYEIVQHAGKLLRTYPLANLYDNHHFTIIVDGKSISVLDGDKMIIVYWSSFFVTLCSINI